MHIPYLPIGALLLALSPAPPSRSPPTLAFTPRHAHAYSSSLQTFFHDARAPPAAPGSVHAHTFGADAGTPVEIRTTTITIRRPRARPPHMLSWAESARAVRRGAGAGANTTGLWVAPAMSAGMGASGARDEHDTDGGGGGGGYDGGWEDVDVSAPDMTDRQTVLALAKMTSNAYTTPDAGDWYPLGAAWNASTPFGWEPGADGLRGHVFADDKNETVIIALKGTSAGVLGSGGPTSKNDKYNDNLMFSCCCARVDFSWTPVCDCYAGGYRCGQTCLEDALIEESVYATVGTNLYNNVTYMYPNADVWLVGHSLGGSLASLIGLSFGAPAVGFEAPGDRLPARRLHLPLPPAVPAARSGVTHVYHTADPIPNGVCTGAYSGCYAAGFALESKCHVGQTILYDTVTVKGWAVDVRTHRIGEIIDKVLADPWPVNDTHTAHDKRHTRYGAQSWWGWGRRGKNRKGGGDGDSDDDDDDDDGGWEKHGGVPKALAEDDCVDCFRWEFGEWDKKDEGMGGDTAAAGAP
ncbi:putative lipase atg15 [Cryptotrichosporon argae]